MIALVLSLIVASALPFPSQILDSRTIYAENQTAARGVAVEYTVAFKNPISHLYDIEMSIRGVREASVSVSMPAWAPGAYRILNFSKNVQDFRAVTTRGQPLSWEQTDKQTWRIAKTANDDVVIRYQVYSKELDDQMADISGPAVFMYVVGQKHVPSSVKYESPRGWDVYTGLEKRGDRYYASDYDIFVDAPAFIGQSFKVLEFEAGGATHRLVFSKPDISMTSQQVVADVHDIIDQAIAIFGNVPYKSYIFLVKVQPQTGSGGVEHLNSTRMTVGENDFVNQASYRRFLFVVAHEFVHLWNGKRIRPQVLGPFDYTREVQTRMLWMSEGFTSYYADLLLLRTGVFAPSEFLDTESMRIDTLQHAPGRHLMSAEEASWKVWTPSDNAVNNSISYYVKGEIIGMLLDLEIRARTGGSKSLDDVMRYLMEHYARMGIGFSENGFLQAVETVAGSDFHDFYHIAVQSREELDYDSYLKQVGLVIQVNRQPATIHIGVEFERADGNLVRIRRILPNSPAERAGLDTGDIVISMAGERMTFDNFRSRLHSHRIGETVKLSVMRGERLMTTDIVPAEFQEERWAMVEQRTTPEQRRLKNEWLGIQ